MIPRFVLSTFPGCGNLDRGFIATGYQVVACGDPLFGQPGLDQLTPPPDVFEGIIGGPPCLPWAATRRGHQHEFPNLIPLFERTVAKAQPTWFLMENVPAAPVPDVPGYDVQHTLIYAEELGSPQRRPRRFSFGSRTGRCLILWPSGERGRYKYTIVPGEGGSIHRPNANRATQTGAPYLSTKEMAEAFGMPAGWQPLALSRWGRRVAIGQSVPVQVATAIAACVRTAVEGQRVSGKPQTP